MIVFSKPRIWFALAVAISVVWLCSIFLYAPLGVYVGVSVALALRIIAERRKAKFDRLDLHYFPQRCPDYWAKRWPIYDFCRGKDHISSRPASTACPPHRHVAKSVFAELSRLCSFELDYPLGDLPRFAAMCRPTPTATR